MPDLTSGLAGAVTGALTGGLVSWWLNGLQGRLRVWNISRNLELAPQPQTGSRLTARVINDSPYPIHGAIAYISIDHELEDVLPPPLHFRAHIYPSHLKRLTEDRLCWSLTSPNRNPHKVDIYAGERQSLDLFDLGQEGRWIEIPSEEGYSSSQTEQEANRKEPISSQIFLRSDRKYQARVRIVSSDTSSRTYDLEIDAKNQERPVRLL